MRDSTTDARSAESDSDLTRWKTQAWADPGLVRWYSGRMVENETTNYLKNHLEINTIKRFVSGLDVLDIGVGTGRAALPLMSAGYNVTGVDSSQAMLNEVRRLAGDGAISLKQGDLFRLPFDNAVFDCAVALNVLVHFADWRDSLREWQRILRPGGRIIFDIHSLDHVTAAYGPERAKWPPALLRTEDPENFREFHSRITVDELVRFADEAGLSIVAVVPYGAFLGGGNVNWLHYDTLESTHKWKRVLSWFAKDPALLELGIFLEEAVIAHLTPRLAGRMFVILENKADPLSNARLATDIRMRDQAIDRHNVAELEKWLPFSIEHISAELERLCKPVRNRHFFFLLFRSLLSRIPRFEFRTVLPPYLLTEINEWMTRDRVDCTAVDIARNWSKGCDRRFREGVEVTISLEYHLVRDLLTDYFGIFTGEHK